MSRNVELLDNNDVVVSPATNASVVLMENGKTVQEHIGELESDMFSPVITQTSSMAKFGQGDNIDVSDNVEDGFYTSGVLYGNSLVNLSSNDSYTWIDGPEVNNNSFTNELLDLPSKLKPNTKYLINYVGGGNRLTLFPSTLFDTYNIDNEKIKVVTTRDDINDIGFVPHICNLVDNVQQKCTEAEKSSFKMTIIEYQEGMENWDIPYFEGISSVKMGTLTNTGKNLFNIHGTKYNVDNGKCLITIDNNDVVTCKNIATIGANYIDTNIFVDVKKGESFILSFNSISYDAVANIRGYRKIDNGGTLSVMHLRGKDGGGYVSGTFIAEKTERVYFSYYSSTTATSILNGYAKYWNIQLEKSTVATPYEPYKSNILSPLEEVNLKKVGDICDEFDLTKIENNLTEQIVEVELTENMIDNLLFNSICGEMGRFLIQETVTNFKGTKFEAVGLCDKMPYVYNYWEDMNEYGLFVATNGGLYFKLAYTSSETEDAKAHLKNLLPIKIQYILETPTIKTVNLSGSPVGYKDGHVQLSSEGLIPTLEYSIPTNRTGQITQNSTLLVKHSQELGHLSELFADTYVSTALRRSTLQLNTGVVTQSSDTTSLYENFMALIDYKANKDSIDADDLLHRANTIYLTGGLVDWQYESIMEALSSHKEVSEWQETLSY